MENLYYMVFTTSLFILVFLLLRTAVRNKTSMRLQYALWLLVAVKLLVFPVPQMESFLSVWQLSGIWEDRQQEFQGKAAEAAGVLQTRPQKTSAAGNGHRELQVQPSAEGQLDGKRFRWQEFNARGWFISEKKRKIHAWGQCRKKYVQNLHWRGSCVKSFSVPLFSTGKPSFCSLPA